MSNINSINENEQEEYKKKSQNKDERIKNVLSVLRYYKEWILQNKNNEQNDQSMNMFDIINNKIHIHYNFDMFMKDYHFIIDNKVVIDLDENDIVCSVDQCFCFLRNDREKSIYSTHNEERDKLYFIDNNTEKNDDTIRDCAIQQILDTLHCAVFHTIYVDIKKIKNDDEDNKLNDINDEENELNLTKLCHDKYATKIFEEINKKRMNDKRYRSNQSNRYKTNNKFVTEGVVISEQKEQKNDVDDNVAIYQSEVYGNNQMLIKNEKQKNKKTDFINIDKQNNSKHQTSQIIYSAGYRYFYWNFYKYNNYETNHLFKNTWESNPGYKLKDWFIEKKYDNLRDELVNNKIKKFSIEQCKTTQQKAFCKLNHWKTMRCRPYLHQKYYFYYRCYGIRQSSIITLQHIQAVLFYCNFTDHCTEFSATFRKMNMDETDQELKQRHGEYYHWAKYLRECVECFGTMMANSKVGAFYHGVSKAMLFDSTSIRLNGPVSTTGMFSVAASIFGANGIVIDIQRSSGALSYFNCACWSDFSNEDEKLFLGGMQVLNFLSIRDVPNGLNYKCYVRALTIFHLMIKSYFVQFEVMKRDRKIFKLMMKAEIAQKILNPLSSQIDVYILRLMHNFCIKIKEIDLDLGYMNKHLNVKKFRIIKYGFKKFASLFVLDDGESLNFNIFLNLFPNLEKLIVRHTENKKFVDSISLNKELIFSAISKSKKSSSFSEIVVVKPKESPSSLLDFIESNKVEFVQNGWDLNQTVFKYERKHRECDQALSIKKII